MLTLCPILATPLQIIQKNIVFYLQFRSVCTKFVVDGNTKNRGADISIWKSCLPNSAFKVIRENGKSKIHVICLSRKNAKPCRI